MQHKLFSKKTVLIQLCISYTLGFRSCQNMTGISQTHKHYLLKEIGVPSLKSQWVLSLNRAQPKRNPEHGSTAASEHCHIHLQVCGYLQLKTSSMQTEWPVLYTQEYHGIFCEGSLQQKAQCIFLPHLTSCNSKLQRDPAECVF